jgi:crotonobetainyl-CoA:carnitine CoA-transferase CaiB-like acyl-CoA transferase
MSWRLANNTQVDEIVSAWTATQTVTGALAQLNAIDVACAPVRTPEQVLRWPQLLDRAMLEPLRTPDGQATKALAATTPFRFSRSDTSLSQPAPVPGAHTQSILERYLKLAPEQIEALKLDGVI